MTGRERKTEASSSKSKLPDVPMLVFDQKNNKQYKKGDFLGKVSFISPIHLRQMNSDCDTSFGQ